MFPIRTIFLLQISFSFPIINLNPHLKIITLNQADNNFVNQNKSKMIYRNDTHGFKEIKEK